MDASAVVVAAAENVIATGAAHVVLLRQEGRCTLPMPRGRVVARARAAETDGGALHSHSR